MSTSPAAEAGVQAEGDTLAPRKTPDAGATVDFVVGDHDQHVDIAPVICVAPAERPDEPGPSHLGVGTELGENVLRPLIADHQQPQCTRRTVDIAHRLKSRRLRAEPARTRRWAPQLHLCRPGHNAMLHINREAIHHLADVLVLRDLFRQGGARDPARPELCGHLPPS